MKTIAACIALTFFLVSAAAQATDLEKIRGAWAASTGDGDQLMIIEDGYCAVTFYNRQQKKFLFTQGGILSADKGTYNLTMEFHSAEPNEVGRQVSGKYALRGDRLEVEYGGQQQTWTRVDNSKTALTGCWRISGRLNEGRMNELKLNPRKTLKILSGTKFQWMAINTETREFFGTGGGTYTFRDGKYVEHIEFFSRDSSRVGTSLTFDGRVENSVWFHSGLSSKGDPIDERWIRHKDELQIRK